MSLLFEKKNYCHVNLMAICKAKDSEERKMCGTGTTIFYEKSSLRDDCMYFIFDEYCDCLKAQMKARQINGVQ